MANESDSFAQPEHTLLESGWLALPFLATLGGAWAFARPHVLETPTQLAVALALVVGGWQILWRTLTGTDWATPIGQWRGWIKADPLPSWPYLQPGTPGAHLHHRLAQARAWWREAGRALLGGSLKRAVLALLVSLLLGIALSRLALLLSLCFLALTELAILWHEGDGEVGTVWAGITTAGLPWFLGATLGDGDIARSAGSGIIIALLIGFYAKRSWWALIGPVLGAVFLIWQNLAPAAGWLLLLSLPGLIVLSHRPSTAGYRLAIGPWVMGMIVLLAMVL